MYTVAELLTSRRSHLHQLMELGGELQQLTEKLRQLLPAYLAPHCFVAAIEDEKIIVHSANAAAGTVLRYELPKLVPLLKKDARYQHITQVICHIRPPLHYKKEEIAIPAPVYSESAAALVHETAENITHSEVQKALLKLGKSLSGK